MHPKIRGAMAEATQADLERKARNATRGSIPARAAHPETRVSIRAATPADGPAMAALAALDGAHQPLSDALIAEVDGALAAVLPLDGGRAFADPFRETQELVALLELRARQLARVRQRPSRFGRLAVARRFA